MIVLLTACSGSEEEAAPVPEALVTIANVKAQAVGEMVKLYGVADSGPGGKTGLFAPIEARFVSIEAPVGSAVTKGQVIVRLTPGPTAALDITKARSDAQAASAAFARAIRMRADGLISDAEVETARAAQTSANGTLASLTGRSLVLSAPFAGHVEAINGMPGDLIPAGTSVVSISGNGAVRARFGVDPMQVRNLRAGAPVAIAQAGSRDRIMAHLVSVDPTVDPQSRLASAYADLPATAPLRPGDALTGEVMLAAHGQALVIPYGALLDDAGQPFVYVVAKGVASRRDVVTGPADGAVVAVSKGLNAGDKVVVDGGTALEDGMKVRLK